MYQEHVSLKPYHTFGVEARARRWSRAGSLEDWLSILEAAEREQPKLPLLILGGGSNVLFTQDETQHWVVRNEIKGIQTLHEDQNEAFVYASGGENWHELVLWTIERGLWGIENLALIPGTVGAAPIQNIGAYGVELCDRLHEVDVLEVATGKRLRFSKDACRFGYRDSIFKNEVKGNYLILGIVLQLSKTPQPVLDYAELGEELRALGASPQNQSLICQSIINIRRCKLPDPERLGNAGSFFKNPIISKRQFAALQERFPGLNGHPVSGTQVKISAAWLVEQSGWKGKRQGDAGVYERHALILVNHGSASGSQLRELAFDVMDSVRSKFDIVLVPEVNLIR